MLRAVAFAMYTYYIYYKLQVLTYLNAIASYIDSKLNLR